MLDARASSESAMHAAGDDGGSDGLVRESARTRDPLELPVLVLNRLYEPVRITTARRAFVLLYAGSPGPSTRPASFTISHAGESCPCAWGSTTRCASSAASSGCRACSTCGRYGRSRRPAIRLTRRNVMLRDDHQCQYCGRRPAPRDLNIDHVMPARGAARTPGPTS